MTTPPPKPARSSTPAGWLTGRLDFWARDWVTGTVGPGFAAYARVFHPLGDGPNAERWADVAASHGLTMHASAEWDRVNRVPPDFPSGRGYPGDPQIGHLAPVALTALCAILAGHTGTPEQCWFALWNGWGWQHAGAHSYLQATESGQSVRPITVPPQEWQLDLTGPTFSLPGRDYHLFSGTVLDAVHFGHWVVADWFDPQSPSIFWPTDHAWCVSTEIDADSTLVGGSRDLITEIVASPALEALPIYPGASQVDTRNGD